MTTDTTAGGFTGDPAAAFAPPAAGGCCGSTPVPTSTAPNTVATAATCCGTAEAAKADAVRAEAGCCG